MWSAASRSARRRARPGFRSREAEHRSRCAGPLGRGLVDRRLERGAGVLAEHREHHPLDAATSIEVAADLLDLDPCRLVHREAADAGAERDKRERFGAELVGPRERAGGQASVELLPGLWPPRP